MKSLAVLKNDPDRLLQQEELCEFLDKTASWAERARWSRTGPRYIKVGRSVFYKAADVLAFIEGGAVETNQHGQAA